MNLSRSTTLLAVPLLTLACWSQMDPGKDEAATPPPFDGKADVGDRVIDSGELSFGPDAAVLGVFDEDLQFFAWRLRARADSRVTIEVTQRGSSRGLDTTLYLYGPRSPEGGYGTSAIAFDDDSGWGTLSRLSNVALPAMGEYLVVLGTHDARGRGNFRMLASCLTGECAPLPVPEPVQRRCHEAIANAVFACVEDFEADSSYDPSSIARTDIVELCADAEIVAPAWDGLCQSPDALDDVCAEPYEVFATTYLRDCRTELVHEVLGGSCVFGSHYRDLWWRPAAVVLISEQTLTINDPRTSIEEIQIIEAVRTTTFTEVATVEEAFSVVDDGIVNLTELWDASNRRAFTSVEVGAGDNSFGMIFEHGTTASAARIEDGDLVDCEIFWGSEMRPCESSLDCAEGAWCTGGAEPSSLGRCIDTSQDGDEYIECSSDEPCPAGSGLICACGFICNPGWMQGRFVLEPDLPIPDNDSLGAEAQVLVYGLASVSTDVALDLVVTHTRPSDLVISVVNPEGTEVVVFDREPVSDEIYLRSFEVSGFPGDEPANGIWRVRAVDTVSGATGKIGSFGLTIKSRWD